MKPFEITREDIENLRYLRNARTAAAYLGIPEVQVEDVWAEMPAPRPSHSGKDGYKSEAAHKIAAIDYAAATRPENEAGSELLRERTLRAMLRWANDNGTNIDRAAAFLLSGRALEVA